MTFPWIKISGMESLPKKTGKSSYEYVECLIFHEGEVKLRPFNCEHGVWDDEEHDDFFCGPLEPTHYLILENPEE